MRPRRSWGACALLLCAVLGAGACRAGADAEREERRPAPTENPLDEQAEGRQRAPRERWMELMHRAAPGVEWRAIERANAEAEVERRNQLAAQHVALPPTRWSEVGSRNQAGRTRCAALGVDTAGNPRLYTGTDRGGVWRGNLDGT